MSEGRELTNPTSPNLLDKFSRVLQRHDWRVFFPDDMPFRRGAAPPSLRMDVGKHSSVAADLAFFERRGERTLVADFCRPGIEPDPGESPDSLFERYLDLSLRERLTLWSVCRLTRADLLLCATPEGVRLLDAAEEVPLGSCSAAPSDEEIARCLRVLETKSAAERPAPDGQRLSGELVRWFDLAGGKLGRPLKWGRGDFQRLARHLLLGLKCLAAPARAQRPLDFSRLGLRVSADGDGVRLAWNPPSVPDLVDRLLETAHEFSPVGTGSFPPLERRALVRRLRDVDRSAVSVLEGVERLAAAKFRAPVQLGALMPTEGEPVSWRLAVTDPLRVAERIESEDLYVFQPLELDLSECGVGRVLEAVEKLALHAAEQKNDFERAGGRQLDMVENEAEGRDDGDVLEDPFNWLCGRALRLRVSDAYRESLAYLVASHVVELRSRAPFRNCRPVALTSLPDLFES